jgi:hypothetical protein
VRDKGTLYHPSKEVFLDFGLILDRILVVKNQQNLLITQIEIIRGGQLG